MLKTSSSASYSSVTFGTMLKNRFLSSTLVRRFADVDRVAVAKVTGASPKWVRDVLAGREPVTGKMAEMIIAEASKVTAK